MQTIDLVFAIFLICMGIYCIVEILETLSKWIITTFEILGFIVYTSIFAGISVFLSSALLDISTAQAAVQFIGTNVALASVGLGVFGAGNTEDKP